MHIKKYIQTYVIALGISTASFLLFFPILLLITSECSISTFLLAGSKCNDSLFSSTTIYLFSIFTIVNLPVILINSAIITALHARSKRFDMGRHVFKTILISTIVFYAINFLTPPVLRFFAAHILGY
jgi:hypothetical protein